MDNNTESPISKNYPISGRSEWKGGESFAPSLETTITPSEDVKEMDAHLHTVSRFDTMPSYGVFFGEESAGHRNVSTKETVKWP